MSQPPHTKDAQRIAKLLARAGVASRREIERMIAERRIAIDGVAIETPATLLASLDGVTVDGNPVEAPQDARLFVFHKPAGILVTERDPKGRETIYDHLPADLPRVVPVGRLDINTEGLLLLTTDGELKRQLELPATGIKRAYRARAYGRVAQEQLEALIEGVEIEGIHYGAIDANLERRTGANVWIEMILTEGKNREVRRVLDHLGLKVSRLIRTRYGPFVLADLAPGAVGEVRVRDVASFRQRLEKGIKDEDAIVVDVLPGARRTPPGPRHTPDARGHQNQPRARVAPGTKSARPGKPSKPVEEPTGPSPRETVQTLKPRLRKRGVGWAKAKPRPRPGGRRS